jgi:hypothetical protein
MKRSILLCVTAVVLTGSAWAQDKEQKPEATGAQAPTMDLSKVGPPARKPTNEKQTKKEIEAFYKRMEEIESKGDFEGMVAAHDFPIYMATDDMQGMPHAKEFSREEFVATMKPMHERMPKDVKVTHKPTITVLSDSLANVTDNYTVTMGKQKVNGRSAGLLVKRDGQWKWKVMSEAGWGNMAPQGVGGSQMPSEGE